MKALFPRNPIRPLARFCPRFPTLKSVLLKSLLLIPLVLIPQGVFAQTMPLSGGVAKPSGFNISLPFTAGENVYLTSGYSPSMGSSLHDGLERTCCANDYYALDMTLPDHPNNGLGEPVRAIASGTVVKAGWATSGWANYGLRVYIEHDYNADGHKYISMYAHLDQIDVSEGQTVAQGDIIGTLGDSCEGDSQNRSCPFFGPHLHFAIHQDSGLGGSGTGGSYGGHAVVPEPIDGYTNLQQGQTLVSGNNGQPPAPCAVIEPSGITIDDGDACFSRRGTPSYWHNASNGHDGDHIWTHTTNDAQSDNHAFWNLHFAQAGDYEIRVYIPGNNAESEQARYTVRHNGSENDVVINQSSNNNGWVSLGDFTFAEGDDQWVRLIDNTGEPYVSSTNNTKIAFDALQVQPASTGMCACSGAETQTRGCGACGEQTRSCDGCNWGDWSQCSGEGVCEAGTVDEETCSDGQPRQRVCDQSCSWSGWTECGEEVEVIVLDQPEDMSGDMSSTDADMGTNNADGVLSDTALPGADGGNSGTLEPGDMNATGDCACSIRASSERNGSSGTPAWPGVLMLFGLVLVGRDFRRRRETGKS